jgi:hypothetical protein
MFWSRDPSCFDQDHHNSLGSAQIAEKILISSVPCHALEWFVYRFQTSARGGKKRVWNRRWEIHTRTRTSRERDGETREWKQGTRFVDYNCKCTLVPNNPVMRVRHRWCFGFRFSFFGFGFFILGDDIDLLGKCLRDSFVSKDLELESSGIWGFEIWGLRGKFRPS